MYPLLLGYLSEAFYHRCYTMQGMISPHAALATGNVIRDHVEAYRERCHLHYAAVETFPVEEWMEELRKACRCVWHYSKIQ